MRPRRSIRFSTLHRAARRGYRYDSATGESTLFARPGSEVQSDDFVTEQVFFASRTAHEGAHVPLLSQGVEESGKNPVYLYGFGGFNAR